jgi:hypothetical protein
VNGTISNKPITYVTINGPTPKWLSIEIVRCIKDEFRSAPHLRTFQIEMTFTPDYE